MIEGLIEKLLARALVVDIGGSINAVLTIADYPLDTSRYVMTVDQEATVRAEFFAGCSQSRARTAAWST